MQFLKGGTLLYRQTLHAVALCCYLRSLKNSMNQLFQILGILAQNFYLCFILLKLKNLDHNVKISWRFIGILERSCNDAKHVFFIRNYLQCKQLQYWEIDTFSLCFGCLQHHSTRKVLE